MLLTILVNLNMVGGGPAPPTPTGQGGGEGDRFKDEAESQRRAWVEKLWADDEDAIWMAGSWLVEKQNN